MLVVKNPSANARDSGDLVWIPGSRKIPGEGNGNPFQCFCLKNSMDRGAWWATVHGVAESQTGLNTHTPCHPPHRPIYFCSWSDSASAGTTFGTSSSGSSGPHLRGGARSLPWRCCWCPLGTLDASVSQRSPGRAQGSSRWPCAPFAPGLAPMWLLPLLRVTFSVEASSALALSWGSPLWKRSLGIAEPCWSLQKQDAFSPEVCGIQLPNEAYLIKELVPIEFSRWNYGFFGRGMKGAVGSKVEEKLFSEHPWCTLCKTVFPNWHCCRPVLWLLTHILRGLRSITDAGVGHGFLCLCFPSLEQCPPSWHLGVASDF